VNALPSPEHNHEVVLAPIHSSAGTLCTRVGYWRRRPPSDRAVFSTFARLRPIRSASFPTGVKDVVASFGCNAVPTP
jgi:hypothetical protein